MLRPRHARSVHVSATACALYWRWGGRDLPDLCRIEDIDFSTIDMAFCALPHATSQAVIATLPRDVKVVDLSAEVRVRDADAYETWYGKPHSAVELQ